MPNGSITSLPALSFEYFPPADEPALRKLWDCQTDLESLNPRFVSVTYGAGGTTQDRTLRVVSAFAKKFQTPIAAHITCVGVAREQVDRVLEHYIDAGVRRIVALRGDAAGGSGAFTPHPEGYQGSVDLVRSIARRGDVDIAVGCYPEVHPEAISATSDVEHLKRKQDAGATRAISQFFFDADVFLNFVDRARAAGVTIPITPGILPIRRLSAVERLADRCGTVIPAHVRERLAPLDDDASLRESAGVDLCHELCARLRANGVEDFHFYTLNRADLTRAVCERLGMRDDAQPTMTKAQTR
jgi:methylenetetrahydrofolate reductase (NADPH)